MRFAIYPTDAALAPFQILAVRRLLEIDGVERTGVIETAGGDLDFVLNFTPEGPAPSIREPRFGIWTFRYGLGRDGPAVARLERAGTGILAECAIQSDKTSYARTLDSLRIAAADLPGSVCKDLLHGKTLPSLDLPPLLPLQIRGQRAAWMKLQLTSLLLSESWNVGVVDAPIQRFLDPAFQPGVVWLPKIGKMKFVADPFAIADGDQLTIFVEEFDYNKYQGYISAINFREGTVSSPPQVLIDEGTHMSYPFLLRHRGELYCVPEMCGSLTVRLYRLDPARNTWHIAATIISDFPAVDSTILEHDGKWWLFCTNRDDFPDAKLYLWHADDLFGPWRPHWKNPVKCDVTSSRPGGTPFLYGGALYRPAQDSSVSYGGAVAINRVHCLTADEFKEETVVRIPPLKRSPYPDGIHTLSGAGRYTVIDGKRMALLTPRLTLKLAHKFKRAVQAARGRHRIP